MITGSLTIQRLLASMKKLDASDLHVKAGIPPTYRIGGNLRAVDAPPITEEEADHLLDPILTPIQKAKFDDSGNLDFSASLPDGESRPKSPVTSSSTSRRSIPNWWGKPPTD